MQDLDKILRSLKETLESSKPLGPFSVKTLYVLKTHIL